MGCLVNTNATLVGTAECIEDDKENLRGGGPTLETSLPDSPLAEGPAPLPAPTPHSPLLRLWYMVINHGGSCHFYQLNRHQLSPGHGKGEDGLGRGGGGMKPQRDSELEKEGLIQPGSSCRHVDLSLGLHHSFFWSVSGGNAPADGKGLQYEGEKGEKVPEILTPPSAPPYHPYSKASRNQLERQRVWYVAPPAPLNL